MESQANATSPILLGGEAVEAAALYGEGIVAGTIGAATIAIWFLILDTLQGRPLHTPTILGAALVQRGQGLASPAQLPVAFEMVVFYTWVHWLVFCAIGGGAARLLRSAERDANLGFGIVLLLVVFEFGFVVAAMLFAEPVLHALTWPAVLVGNLLAVAAMGWYFWRRHPDLTILP